MLFFNKKKKAKENTDGETAVNTFPYHVAIIMDGNGRWASASGKPRSYGHKIGAENVERIVSHAFGRGVKALSLYAFSSENWSRPEKEVDKIFSLIVSFLKKYIKKAEDNGVKVVFSGDLTALPKKLLSEAEEVINGTKCNDKFVLNIALNYGARTEIARAASLAVKNGEPVTPETVSKYLYTADIGDPELIIRTGGELRLSNFMLFQAAYSELYFTKVMWPDFDEEEFDKALEDFSKRKRRFGGI